VLPVISEIRVVDDPGAWRSAGFAVAGDGSVTVGRTTLRVDAPQGGPGEGIAGWTLAAATATPPPGGTLDGLPTDVVAAPEDVGEPDAPPAHPNGCTKVDHVVVITPDLDRTTAALATVGLDARRTREAGAGPDGQARHQRFFRLGEVILEVVGPATPTGEGPARFWGLAYEVDDLDATAAGLGDRLSRPRDAVQAGRRIAALSPAAGVSVPTAFLTPGPRRDATR
jgi:hypothetical protein